jgi:hypothetical protein
MDSERHLDAASRHDAAAASHDRSAKWWHERGNHRRASLQQALADHERHGAKLERRWAALIVEEAEAARA